ncbi:MAG: hypothetical protein IJM30_11695 [Thermoguttaceae bacterium]|nr:hypothetical protein [Thermoguttaceae bacterium]
MTRVIIMGIVMAFAVGFVGCRSCLAPYDHCQPTFLPERGDQCMGELYRCGSNLGGMERRTNEDGYCESCCGGQVEYYSANGETTVVENASEAQYAQSSLPNYPSAGQIRQASVDGSEFALYDDANGESY